MKLGRMKDGRFFRNIGYLDGGSQPKFYLGRDEAEALVRAGKIEQIWRLFAADFQYSEPHWFGFPFELVKAVAQGRVIEQVPVGWIGSVASLSPSGLATWDSFLLYLKHRGISPCAAARAQFNPVLQLVTHFG